MLTLYLAILALIAYGAYTSSAPSARERGPALAARTGRRASAANASAIVGQAIFAMLSVFQLMLVAFIAPAFTAGAISLEREKQTLDLLITTPLRPGAIVVGKLLSALAFVVLMILAGDPGPRAGADVRRRDGRGHRCASRSSSSPAPSASA